MYSKFRIIPPATILFNMESGAVQGLKGTIVGGIWRPTHSFFVNLPYDKNGTSISRDLDEELAAQINWNEVAWHMAENDYANLPSRMDLERKPIVDILASLGVLHIDLNPNVVINGKPQKNIVIHDKYKMSYIDRPIEEIIYRDMVEQ